MQRKVDVEELGVCSEPRRRGLGVRPGSCVRRVGVQGRGSS